jgi:thiol-disulfide isomerase/thioredoxin
MIINVTDSRNLNRLNSMLPKKDFFLWFYADWCGHCKSMEPEWKKLVTKCGNKYNLARVRDDHKDQLINNIGQSVQGFPTLGSTNNSSNFNTYEGPRTATDFMEHIKKNLDEEKAKRSMKRKSGCSRCAGNNKCQCSRCKAKRSNSPCAKRPRRGRNNSRKRIVFVKPKKGCGGRSKRLRAINL